MPIKYFVHRVRDVEALFVPLKRLSRIRVSMCRERFETPLCSAKIKQTQKKKKRKKKKEKNTDIFKYFSN